MAQNTAVAAMQRQAMHNGVASNPHGKSFRFNYGLLDPTPKAAKPKPLPRTGSTASRYVS